MFRRNAIGTAPAIGPKLFLTIALRPGFGFNFIPFALHQALFSDVMDETLFIHIFGILVALLFFVTTRRLLMGILEKH